MDLTSDTPFTANPPVLSVFENFIGFSNNEVCAITELVGNIQFLNFKCVDNKTAGIEIAVAGVSPSVTVTNAVIVGKSGLNDSANMRNDHRGFIGPGEGFDVLLDGVNFYNYDDTIGTSVAALSTCSHCFFSPSTFAGRAHYSVQKLNVLTEPSVKRFIRWETQ